MPGPKRQYPTNADRQRAYRKRNKPKSPIAHSAEQLRDAVHQAALAGDDLAKRADLLDPVLILDALTDHFHDLAGTPPEQRPAKRNA